MGKLLDVNEAQANFISILLYGLSIYLLWGADWSYILGAVLVLPAAIFATRSNQLKREKQNGSQTQTETGS
jgi:hypothetical protein